MLEQHISAARRQLESLAHRADTLSEEQKASVVSAFNIFLDALSELDLPSLSGDKVGLGRSVESYLLGLSSDGYLTTDLEGVIQTANPAALNLLNVSQDRLIGRPIAPFIANAEAEPVTLRSQVARLQVGEVDWIRDWAVRLLPYQGAPFMASATIGALHDDTGRLVCLHWLLVDDRQGVAPEDTYRLLIDRLPQGLTIVQDNQICFANSAIAKMTGYTVDDLVSLPPAEMCKFIHPDDQERLCKSIKGRLAEQAEPERHEARMVRKDNLVRWLEITCIPTRYQARPAVQITYTDITKHKETELALTDSEQKYRDLFEHASDAIFIIDPATRRFLDVNESAARRLGYTREELLQLKLDDIQKPADQINDQSIIWESRTSGSIVMEYIHLHKDGTEIPVEVSTRSIQYGDRQVIQNFARDIAVRKQAEAALRQRNEELRIRNEELDAFAHTVAHDLKDPLNRAIGFSEVTVQFYETFSKEEIIDNAARVVRAGQRMNRIIDELLLLASVRKAEVQTTPLNMSEIINQVLERVASLSEQCGAEIILPDSESWPVVLGYPAWIEEVWANYISNACKYGGRVAHEVGQEAIAPRVELGFTVQDDGMVRFWVRDNGAGIAQENLAQLFTPFNRLGQAKIEGHGLGLSIVRRIIDKLGGQVRVESTVGEGSIFSFTLPAVQQVGR